MPVLPIIKAPDPVLKTVSKPVKNVDGKLVQSLNDMLETMYADNGVGLAANQVGLTVRVLVMDVEWRNEDSKGHPYKMINPEVVWKSEEINVYNEGCLSFPGHYADVERPKQVRVKYLDEKGSEQFVDCDGLLATCVQHEIDHLDGINFVDHISRMKRDIIMRKMIKAKKLGVFDEEDEAETAHNL